VICRYKKYFIYNIQSIQRIKITWSSTRYSITLMSRTFPRFTHDHFDKKSLPSEFTLNFPQSLQENRRSPPVKISRFLWSPGGTSSAISSSYPFHSRSLTMMMFEWKEKLENTPDWRTLRWSALPTLPTRGAHHVREFLGDVREFRLHISLAFANGIRSSLSPRDARARPLACPPCRLFL